MVFMRQRLRVPVYYDFASSLCYVAHRIVGQLGPDLEELGIELVWTPLDLASLLGIRRGGLVEPRRRENAQRVARELGVAVHVPHRWMDSRNCLAASLLVEDGARQTTWRERVWSEIYEANRPAETVEDIERLGRELGWSFDREVLADAGRRVAQLTFEAGQALVTGVPTFMLGEWPFGGIQELPTMRAILRRFVERRRAGLM